MIVKGSVLLALAGGVLAALQPSAAGAQLRCTEQRVEYLVGGRGLQVRAAGCARMPRHQAVADCARDAPWTRWAMPLRQGTGP